MATRGPSAPRGRRFYIKGVGAIGSNRVGAFVFRTAPLRRKKKPSLAQYYAQGTLEMATIFARVATAWEVQTSKDIAGRSGYTWKDQLIAMFYGTGVEFTDIDGVQWRGRRILAAEIQTLLDSISSAPGSILVRTDNGWAVLFPGTPGYALTMSPATNLPDWLPAGGGAGGGQPDYAPGLLQANDGTTNTAGTAQFASVFVPKNFEASGVLIMVTALGGGGGINSMLYDANPSQPHTLLASSTLWVPAAPGLLWLPFTTSYQFTADSIAWIAVRTAGTSPTFATNISSRNRSPTIAYPPPTTAPSIAGTPTGNLGMILRGVQH